jgi:hypothetical protein
MSSEWRLASVLPALAAALGCAGPMRAQSLEAVAPQPPGVIFVVGGIGGWDPLPRSAELVFPRLGVPHKVCDFIWTHGWGQLFRDLQDTPHVARKAAELAALIAEFKACEPDRPVYLLAKSGGAGLALLAAERLPPGTLERIILLSAAVSPGYDLCGALRATRGEIVSFYSRHDRVILGWGTSRFGTIDRVRGPGAGLTGFVPPPDLDEEERGLYRRLVQIHWKPSMLLQGYAGMHSLNSFPLFLAVQVAPWLR